MKIFEKNGFIVTVIVSIMWFAISISMYTGVIKSTGDPKCIHIIDILASAAVIIEWLHMRKNYTVFDEEGILFVRDGVEEYYEWDKYEIGVVVFRILSDKTIIIGIIKEKEVKQYYVSYSKKLLNYLKGLGKGLYIKE